MRSYRLVTPSTAKHLLLPLKSSSYILSSCIARMTILSLGHWWSTFVSVIQGLGRHTRDFWSQSMTHLNKAPTYFTNSGAHVIRQPRPDCIYISIVPQSNTLFIANPPSQPHHIWRTDQGVQEFLRNKSVLNIEDSARWNIVGPKATQGCYIEGGGFSGYIVEEIGLCPEDPSRDGQK